MLEAEPAEHADPQSVGEVDLGELGRRGAYEEKVAGGEGAGEAGIGATLRGHEQMFA